MMGSLGKGEVSLDDVVKVGHGPLHDTPMAYPGRIGMRRIGGNTEASPLTVVSATS